MPAPAKYLFDADFGGVPSPASDTVAKRAAADAEARGYQAGYTAAEGQAQQQHATALVRAGAILEQLAASLSAIERRLEAEAVEVAFAVARKLAPQLIAREPMTELKALITDCFAHLVTAPHVVVRVNESLFPQIKEELEAIAVTRGLIGRLVVLAEADIEPGDCRVEWADGGVARERLKIDDAILDAVNNYVAVRRGALATS